MDYDPFGEYLIESEPDRQEKEYAWKTAMALQAADGLQTSNFLLQTAIRNINGEITLEQANALVQRHYQENPARYGFERVDEADKVCARMAALLTERAFSFRPPAYLSIHKNLFAGIDFHAGQIRDCSIRKQEWILGGKTVMYSSAAGLEKSLEDLFCEETKFSYKGLSMDEIIHHLAGFVSRLWQLHVFGEGNTQTTAAFFLQYARTLGFRLKNPVSPSDARYFRNALVIASFSDLKNGEYETSEYLELFLRSLLLNESHPLPVLPCIPLGRKETEKPDIESAKSDIQSEKADFAVSKPDIETRKPDIEAVKPDIEMTKSDFVIFKADIEKSFSPRTAGHFLKLAEAFSNQGIFGRGDVMKVTALKSSRASELIKEMAAVGILEPVFGHGKGKYRFRLKS